MTIRLQVDMSEVIRMCGGMLVRTDLQKGLGDVLHGILLKDALRQFQSGGLDPAWAPLKAATIKEKERLGYPRLTRSGTVSPRLVQLGSFGPANILERSGALLSSWTDGNDPDHYVAYTNDSIEMGSTLSYAKFHQNPSAGNLPQRSIGITDQAMSEVADAIQQFVTGGTA